jgi:hypothetical protein
MGPWPPTGLAYHPSGGQGPMPSAPPHLERETSVPITFEPVAPANWKRGDYRMAASLKAEAASIDVLAARVNASVEHFVEPGLGNGKSFGVRSSLGRQVAFDSYEGGGYGPNLLVLFEGGVCRRSEVLEALTYFGIALDQVYWLAPEMKDV